MPTFHDHFPSHLQEWALAQPLFFTGSAPLDGRHINISPKGLVSSTFSIFNPNLVGYIDATGSAAETISHIYENGRVTVMFTSFDPKPMILRLFCMGRVVEYDTPEFGEYLKKMGKEGMVGARAVILLDIWKVSSSCGYSVPIFWGANDNAQSCKSTQQLPSTTDSKSIPYEERTVLEKWLIQQVKKDKLADYQVQWNAHSLDGLPGLKAARRRAGETIWLGDAIARFRRALHATDAIILGISMGLILALFLQRLQQLLVSTVIIG